MATTHPTLTDCTALKRSAYRLLHDLAQGRDPSDIFSADAVWHGPYPWNDRVGPAQIAPCLAALRRALPDAERRDLIFVAGPNLPDARAVGARRGALVAAVGHLQGTFAAPLFGIAPTGGVVHLRYCEAHALEADRIAESWVMFDWLDLMWQAEQWPLRPSAGAQGLWLGPKSSHDPCAPCQPEEGQRVMDTVLEMHAALGDWDGQSIDSMNHAHCWTPDFMWYGPAGIGSTRGMAGFRTFHQVPFLEAFPDRRGDSHYIRIADGEFAVTGGRPSVVGTQTGEFLGLPPSGRRIEMRVMDFYRGDGSRLAENWVPIDICHMAHQMGHELLPDPTA